MENGKMDRVQNLIYSLYFSILILAGAFITRLDTCVFCYFRW